MTVEVHRVGNATHQAVMRAKLPCAGYPSTLCVTNDGTLWFFAANYDNTVLAHTFRGKKQDTHALPPYVSGLRFKSIDHRVLWRDETFLHVDEEPNCLVMRFEPNKFENVACSLDGYLSSTSVTGVGHTHRRVRNGALHTVQQFTTSEPSYITYCRGECWLFLRFLQHGGTTILCSGVTSQPETIKTVQFTVKETRMTAGYFKVFAIKSDTEAYAVNMDATYMCVVDFKRGVVTKEYTLTRE